MQLIMMAFSIAAAAVPCGHSLQHEHPVQYTMPVLCVDGHLSRCRCAALHSGRVDVTWVLFLPGLQPMERQQLVAAELLCLVAMLPQETDLAGQAFPACTQRFCSFACRASCTIIPTHPKLLKYDV